METNPLQTALEKRVASHGKDSVINLVDSSFHENGFVPDPETLRECFDRYLAARNYRPDPLGDSAAREAVATYYAGPGSGTHKTAKRRVRPDRILLTASSSESYHLLFQTFCEPGDNVLIPSPSYPLFEDLLGFSRLEARFYRLHRESGWDMDLAELEGLADERTRFIVLISPNNPCGSLLSDERLAEIVAFAEKHSLWIISDEVFSEFLYTRSGLGLPRALTHAEKTLVFTLNGISKIFGSPDLKLGWIALSGGPENRLQEVIEELELRNDTFLNCNAFSQFALPTLFRTNGPWLDRCLSVLASRRDLLVDLIAGGLPEGAEIIVPQAGIHFVLGLPKTLDDEEFAVSLISSKGIYTHPGYLYGIEDRPSLVLSLLSSSFETGIRELLAAL